MQRVQDAFGTDIETARKAVDAMQKAVTAAMKANKNATEDGGVRYAKKSARNDTSWAYDENIISKKDRGRFFSAIAEISKREYNSFPRTIAGEYIIESDNKLMFTDGNWENPSLSAVIVFNDEYETTMYFAKEVVYDEARNTPGYGDALRIIEKVFGDGYAQLYDREDYKSDGGEDGRRKGTNRNGDTGATGSGQSGTVTQQTDDIRWSKKDEKDSAVSETPTVENYSEKESKYTPHLMSAKEANAIIERNSARNNPKAPSVIPTAKQAKANRAALEAKAEQYGAIEQGENPTRDITVPNRIDPLLKIRKGARTFAEASATNDMMATVLDKDMLSGAFNYTPQRNSDTIESARQWVDSHVDVEEATMDWYKDYKGNMLSADMVARGFVIYNNLAILKQERRQFVYLCLL